jgi:hypothetical protein
LAIAIAVLCAGALSQPPVPTPRKDSQPEQTHPAETKKQPDTDKSTAKSAPTAVDVIPTKAPDAHTASKDDSGGQKTFLGYSIEAISAAITALATIVIACFTIALACSTKLLGKESRIARSVAIKTARAAKQSAEVAENTLIATQRPWIQVKLIAAGPLVFGATPEDQEGRINLAFLARNVGNSPAVRISLHAKLTISNTIDLRTEQRVYSDSIRESRERVASQPNAIQPEITLFPGDQFPLQVVAYMNAEPLAKFREWAGTHPGAIILPAIVGSVFYELTFAKGHHQTGIIYAIHKRTPYPDGHPLPGYARIPPDYPITNVEGAIHLEGVIPDSDLVLRQNIVGTGPVD